MTCGWQQVAGIDLAGTPQHKAVNPPGQFPVHKIDNFGCLCMLQPMGLIACAHHGHDCISVTTKQSQPFQTPITLGLECDACPEKCP